MTDQQNLDVRKLEAERFDAGTNERNTRLEIAVDEDVSFGGGNEITREVFASDVIKIPRDTERGEWSGPIVLLSIIG